MICEAFAIVVMPFPFADRNVTRRRPALVLSGYEDFGKDSGVAVVAMITAAMSSNWPFDVPVTDIASAGLRHDCVVRMKLASIDYRCILDHTGRLCEADAVAVSKSLDRLLPRIGPPALQCP